MKQEKTADMVWRIKGTMSYGTDVKKCDTIMVSDS